MIKQILKLSNTLNLINTITRRISKNSYFFSKSLMQGQPKYKLYDIAANLTDQMFGGVYHGKVQHPEDRQQIIQRAKQVGCNHLLIAAGCLEDSIHSYQICKTYENCYATIGVHPCRAKEPFDQKRAKSVDEYFEKLEAQIVKMQDKLVAIGECGLDYDRLQWSTKQQQNQIFPRHFALAQKYNLPMYLHNRNTGNDFFQVVKKNRDRFGQGVVHSFTGTEDEMKQIIQLNFFIGLNGCSLKTAQNLQVVRKIPLQRIMIQTDSPYCEIKNSHASSEYVKTKFPAKQKNKKKSEELVKGRNEPCRIIQVLEAISAIKEIQPQQLAKISFQNSIKLFSK